MRSRYIYQDGNVVYMELGGRVLFDKRQTLETKRSFQVMPDIDPYVSMIDGRVINSRSRHREHLRDHGCEEIGNDSSLKKQPQPIASPPGLKQAIIEAGYKTGLFK